MYNCTSQSQTSWGHIDQNTPVLISFFAVLLVKWNWTYVSAVKLQQHEIAWNAVPGYEEIHEDPDLQWVTNISYKLVDFANGWKWLAKDSEISKTEIVSYLVMMFLQANNWILESKSVAYNTHRIIFSNQQYRKPQSLDSGEAVNSISC